METFVETQKRKGEPEKKQRKRRSGGDMVLYLKERFESEQKTRKEEMEVKQRKNREKRQREKTECRLGDAEKQFATNGDAKGNAGTKQ